METLTTVPNNYYNTWSDLGTSTAEHSMSTPTTLRKINNVLDVVILISPSFAEGEGSLSHVFHLSPLAPPSNRTVLLWMWTTLVQSDIACFSTLP